MTRVGLFVDTTNIYSMCKKKFDGGKLDYEKLYKQVQSYGTVARALAYGTQSENAAASFITKLRHNGFEPIWKQIVTTSGGALYRPDLCVTMAMDIVRLADRLDVIVIGTSNADFAACVDWVREKGIQAIVYGAWLSYEIKSVANKFIEIDKTLLVEQEETECKGI